MSNILLRLPDVSAKTGLGRSTIYAWMDSGDFPKSISLGPRAVGWTKESIDDWIDERIRISRGL